VSGVWWKEGMMKERPILFSTPMVKAILDGKKTQTRRVIKPQPEEHVIIPDKINGLKWNGVNYGSITRDERGSIAETSLATICPYGQPGDTLWVRETWNVCDVGYDGYNGAFEAGYPLVTIPASKPEYGNMVYYKADGNEEPPWRPSIHMPRWASRITLEITAVRVERVQDISEGDAIAEGIDTSWQETKYPNVFMQLDARAEFEITWDTINAKRGYSWDDNPWVWVIEFERIKRCHNKKCKYYIDHIFYGDLCDFRRPDSNTNYITIDSNGKCSDYIKIKQLK